MTLSALDRQSDRTRGVFYAALFNIAANLLVIPRFGAVGTAATTLVTEVLLAVWLRWRVGPLVERLSAGSAALRVGVPAAVMGLVLATLPSLPVLVAIGVGAAVYGVTGSLTGAWSWADLPRLRSV
jgi:O-antigen/teichoic acid export membrane protein